MAIYHLQSKIIGRGQKRSVVAAAAYRAAAALHDAQLNRTHNFLAKPGVIHAEVAVARPRAATLAGPRGAVERGGGQ